MTLRTDASRLLADIDGLAAWREPDEDASTRQVFSAAYFDGRKWIASRMSDAGMRVSVDDGGNLVGVVDGKRAGQPIVTGSHTDTVRGGGRFDGAVGVLAGIEVARSLCEQGVELDHPLWVVDFLGEEPNRWGMSCLGSRAVTGGLTDADLERVDSGGISLGEAMRSADLQPSRAVSASWPPLHAFVELHIEQGPVLEANSCNLGVVTGIVGVHRSLVEFNGRRDHAGTTPMGSRSDASCAAAELMLAVESIARSGGVGTTGRLEIEPGSINVVPDKARLWVELRSTEEAWIRDRVEEMTAAAHDAATRRGATATIVTLSSEPPTPTNRVIRDEIRCVAAECGMRSMDLPSGAEHDARQLALVAPMAMIFVPSAGGRSHCPAEWTEPADLAAGLEALGATIVRLDRLPHKDLIETD